MNNLYEKYKHYPTELVYIVASNLPNKSYTRTLRKAYGIKFDEKLHRNILTDTDINVLNNIYLKMEVYLEELIYIYRRYKNSEELIIKNLKIKSTELTLYERFCEYPAQLVDLVINNIDNQDYINVLKKAYQEDMKGKYDKDKVDDKDKEILSRIYFQAFRPKLLKYQNYLNNGLSFKEIQEMIDKNKEKKLNYNKSIYERYKEYPRELISLVLEHTAGGELINILKKAYGDDLEGRFNKDALTKMEYRRLNTIHHDIFMYKLGFMNKLYKEGKSLSEIIERLNYKITKSTPIKVIRIDEIKEKNLNIESILINSHVANELKKDLALVKVYATVLALNSIVNIKLSIEQIADILQLSLEDTYNYIAEGLEVIQNKVLIEDNELEEVQAYIREKK